MATAEQLKALLRSHVAGDDAHFRAIAMQIASHNARKGNAQLAQELRDLIDNARQQSPVDQPRAIPITRPEGELASLITASYPTTRLADMVLPSEIRERLERVITEHRQRDLLLSYSLPPRRRLLLIGPPGCGKTMTASALAGECQLPLMFVQLHTLITRYLGETAAKLRLVFDAMNSTKGVYLFDEFDALGANRGANNDVGEIRRVLNSFLQFMERDDSDSIVIAATNLPEMLDSALFRRFDDVIEYRPPNGVMAEQLVKNRLSVLNLGGLDWSMIRKVSKGLSHAEIVKACEDAAKDTILADDKILRTGNLANAFRARKRMKGKNIFRRQ